MTERFAIGIPLGVLGFVPRAAAAGSSTWDYAVKPEHFNPHGVLHGGVTMALLDTAMGYALAEIVRVDGAYNLAAQMNVHFLEPVRSGTITARATVRRHGRRLAVVEAEATNDDGRVVAVATATHAIIRPKAPRAPAPDRSR
jgi:uncharacterized protein (TIGR00369 family)